MNTDWLKPGVPAVYVGGAGALGFLRPGLAVVVVSEGPWSCRVRDAFGYDFLALTADLVPGLDVDGEAAPEAEPRPHYAPGDRFLLDSLPAPLLPVERRLWSVGDTVEVVRVIEHGRTFIALTIRNLTVEGLGARKHAGPVLAVSSRLGERVSF